MPTIRSATEADAGALLAIYGPFVRDTTVSFETEVPTAEAFAARIRETVTRWAWLVAEENGTCVAYAYAGSHRIRSAYRWSVEVSAYVAPGYRRRGLGRALYLQLFEQLRERGYCNAYAGIALPNEASLAMHRSLGFSPIGTFRRVGWKFGAWQDVAWLHLPLRDAPGAG